MHRHVATLKFGRTLYGGHLRAIPATRLKTTRTYPAVELNSQQHSPQLEWSLSSSSVRTPVGTQIYVTLIPDDSLYRYRIHKPENDSQDLAVCTTVLRLSMRPGLGEFCAASTLTAVVRASTCTYLMRRLTPSTRTVLIHSLGRRRLTTSSTVCVVCILFSAVR